MKKMVSSFILLLNLATSCSEEYCDPEFMRWCLETKEPIVQPYYPIISLGFNCQVAYQLRLYGLRYEAYPFDWIICPFNAVIKLIEDDFKYFLDPQYLKFIHTENQKHILNTYYDIKFLHDFRLSESFMEDYESVKETYTRRIERFYQKMNESSPALLIRKKINQEESLQLKQVLSNKFPHSNFTIIAVDNNHQIMTNWNIPQIINYYMPQAAELTWKGDPKLWEQLFLKLNLVISREEPKDALFKEENSL